MSNRFKSLGRKLKPALRHLGEMGQYWCRRIWVMSRRFQSHHAHQRRVLPEKLQEFQDDLLEESTLDLNFLVLTIGSCAIATCGLLANSAAVIIGAMIIAPLMLPIRGIAFGALEGELELMRRGGIAITVGTLIGISLACLLGLGLGLSTYGSEVWARSQPTLLDLGVAITAGGISGFAKVQPKLSSALAGTAISVALMPPVCVVGLGLASVITQARSPELAQLDWSLSQGAFLLYLTNLVGITLACMVAFLVAGYTPLSRARRGLTVTLVSTSLLLVPLVTAFVDLLRQSNLESSVQRALVFRTLTFTVGNVQLIAIETDWYTDPTSPEVKLTVIAPDDITPNQVKLLEDFVEREMGQPFTLVFELSETREVRRRPLWQMGLADKAMPTADPDRSEEP